MQKPGRRSLLSVVQREIQKKRFTSFVSQNQRSGTLKPDMNTKRFIKRYRELNCIVCRRGAIGFLCVKWTMEIARTVVRCIPAPFFFFSFFLSLLDSCSAVDYFYRHLLGIDRLWKKCIFFIIIFWSATSFSYKFQTWLLKDCLEPMDGEKLCKVTFLTSIDFVF